VRGAQALAWFEAGHLAEAADAASAADADARRLGFASTFSPLITCSRWPASRWSGGTSTPLSSSPSKRCRYRSGGGPPSSVAKRSVDVDHVTLHRWVQRFTPLLADAARFGRHGVGDRWHVDETYVKIGGRWVYLYRAVDQFGQVIDVYASTRRDTEAVAFPIVLIEHTPGGTIVISQDAANGPNRP
jgi:hypothetical protein